MSSIVVSGDTSGTITIAAPAIAGTTTLTLPTTSGTVLTSASTITPSAGTVNQAALATGVAGTGPAFSAYLPTSNQSLSTATWTKVTLSTEEFDTNNNFDTSTYRFTPTVAGYYLISAFSNINGSTNPSYTRGSLWKNGAEYKSTFLYGSASTNGVITVTSVVYLNGSTDYIEFYVYIAGGSGVFATFGSSQTYMSGFLARGA